MLVHFQNLSYGKFYLTEIYFQNHACLPARATTERPMCRFQSDCYTPKVEVACVYPALDNDTKLLQVFHGRKPPLLFLGDPLDLHYSGKPFNLVTVYIFQVHSMILGENVVKFCITL